MKINPKLQNIDHIHVFVECRREALIWYNDILGLQPLEKIINLPQSGPFVISNEERNIDLAIFKGKPQNNRSIIAFKVTGDDFIHYHDKINDSMSVELDVIDHSIQFSIYFEDPYGNPYEITSYDYDMLLNHFKT